MTGNHDVTGKFSSSDTFGTNIIYSGHFLWYFLNLNEFLNLTIVTDSLSFLNIANYRIFLQAFPVTTLKMELNILIFY